MPSYDLDPEPRRAVCGLPVFTGPVQVSRCQLPDGHAGGVPVMATIGYLAARDLGDGQLEPWEQTGFGTLPLWQSARECRAELDRWGAADQWRVLALVDQDGDE